MVEHCCRTMLFEVEEESAERLVHYDKHRHSYALTIPNHPAGQVLPIAYCPWCAAKLPRPKARELETMTPEICRAVRKAVSMTHRQVADGIGESLETVYRYETGKPTDDAVVAKLLAFFQDFQIAAGRSGRIGWHKF